MYTKVTMPEGYTNKPISIAAFALKLGKEQNMSNEVLKLAKYIANNCFDVTPMILRPALYYTQGFYYAFYAQYLFADVFTAEAYGINCLDISYDIIIQSKRSKAPELTDDEKSIADSVIRHVCCYSGMTLNKIVRSEQPWLQARRDVQSGLDSATPLPQRLIGEYFCDVKKHYNMLNPCYIGDYMRDMFDRAKGI